MRKNGLLLTYNRNQPKWNLKHKHTNNLRVKCWRLDATTLHVADVERHERCDFTSRHQPSASDHRPICNLNQTLRWKVKWALPYNDNYHASVSQLKDLTFASRAASPTPTGAASPSTWSGTRGRPGVPSASRRSSPCTTCADTWSTSTGWPRGMSAGWQRQTDARPMMGCELLGRLEAAQGSSHTTRYAQRHLLGVLPRDVGGAVARSSGEVECWSLHLALN